MNHNNMAFETINSSLLPDHAITIEHVNGEADALATLLECKVCYSDDSIFLETVGYVSEQLRQMHKRLLSAVETLNTNRHDAREFLSRLSGGIK